MTKSIDANRRNSYHLRKLNKINILFVKLIILFIIIYQLHIKYKDLYDDIFLHMVKTK